MGAGRAGCRGDLDPWSRPPTLPPPPAGGGSTFFPAVLQATEQTGLSPEGGSVLHTAAAGGSELPVAGGVQGKRCGGDSALMAVVSLPRTQLAGDEAGGTRRGEVTSVLAQGAGPRSPEHSWPLCSHIWPGSIWPGAEGTCFPGRAVSQRTQERPSPGILHLWACMPSALSRPRGRCLRQQVRGWETPQLRAAGWQGRMDPALGQLGLHRTG